MKNTLLILLTIIFITGCSLSVEKEDTLNLDAEQLKRSNNIFNAGAQEGYQICRADLQKAIEECKPLTTDNKRIEGCEDKGEEIKD